MGVFDIFRTRNIDWEKTIEFDLFDEAGSDFALRRHAIETAVGMVARTISQSEFQTRVNGSMVKDKLYYRLNVRPNKNMSSSRFWRTVVRKMILENECLIIISDEDELLIADSFDHNKFTLFPDTFSMVSVGDITYRSRTFQMNEVIYLEYSNDKMSNIINGLYDSYGKLFSRLMEYQYRKGQIRSIVEMDAVRPKDEEGQSPMKKFMDHVYKTTAKSVHAIIPSQKGITYDEKYSTYQPNVDEVNKVAAGFLEQVALALGIPIALLRGELADVEKQTENYMTFCIKPFIDSIQNELDGKFLTMDEYLRGDRIMVRAAAVENLFSVATKADKLISSGAFTGNELREALGYERSEDPMLDRHMITKNYQTFEEAGEAADAAAGGGDNG